MNIAKYLLKILQYIHFQMLYAIHFIQFFRYDLVQEMAGYYISYGSFLFSPENVTKHTSFDQVSFSV